MRGATSNYPPGSKRPERDPGKRALYDHNKKIILATQSVCGICGRPVDKSLKYPDPMSPTVDHIIPVSRNGDPVSLDNLQLAHRYCNRQKADNLPVDRKQENPNRNLPQAVNWRTF
jgi:5-methylcytosine-specific restriction endonuclease McrA